MERERHQGRPQKGLPRLVRGGPKPDILCVQETKANEEQFPADLQVIEGYHKFYSSAEKKGYSGVALYTSMEPVGVEPGFGIERFDSEGRTIQADMGDFVLFGVYFPNGRSSDERLVYKIEFYDAFLDHIETLRSARPQYHRVRRREHGP